MAAGLIILLVGGDALVRGAVALSSKLGIPTLIVSLTVVAFGTSAPELLIAVQSAFEGVPELALGNVVGSNTANVLLVLGVPALLTGLASDDAGAKVNFYYMVGATAFFIALAFTQPLQAWQGALLLGALFALLWKSFQSAKKSRAVQKALEAEVGETHIPQWQMIVFLAVGMVFLPLGAKLLVDGAVNISRSYGVSEAIVGLTLVALGTSLPELATTVMAGIRKQGDVAIGNVIGSNMFNLLAIMGVASLFGPIPIAKPFFQIDFVIMAASTALLFPFVVLRYNLNRAWGGFFILCYVAYVGFLLS